MNKELLYWLVVVVPRGQTGEQDQDMARMADLQVVLNMRVGNEIPSLLTCQMYFLVCGTFKYDHISNLLHHLNDLILLHAAVMKGT